MLLTSENRVILASIILPQYKNDRQIDDRRHVVTNFAMQLLRSTKNEMA